jgi:ubiquinone/menaquinone biosynthesis C-methylase UbiE
VKNRKRPRVFYGLERLFWDLHSLTWDDKLSVPDYRKNVAAALGWFQLHSPGGRILDVGCGTGNYAIEMAKNGFEVEGIDFSFAMLRKAREKALAEGLSIAFIKADFNKILPFPSSFFDCALCAATLQCVDDPVSFLREISRVTVPKGLIFIASVGQSLKSPIPSDTSFVKRAFWTIKPIFKKTKGIRFYSAFEIEALLKEAGYMILELQPSQNSAVRILARSIKSPPTV